MSWLMCVSKMWKSEFSSLQELCSCKCGPGHPGGWAALFDVGSCFEALSVTKGGKKVFTGWAITLFDMDINTCPGIRIHLHTSACTYMSTHRVWLSCCQSVVDETEVISHGYRKVSTAHKKQQLYLIIKSGRQWCGCLCNRPGYNRVGMNLLY